MPQRTVTTAGIRNPDNSIAANIGLIFKLERTFATSAATIVPRTIAVQTDMTGIFTVSLAVPDVGAALYRCTMQHDSFLFSLEAGTTITLETIIATEESLVVSPNYIQGLINDVDARRLAGDAAVQSLIITDHGGLTGLSDNDHPHYARIANQNIFTERQDIDRTVVSNNSSSPILSMTQRPTTAAQSNFGAEIETRLLDEAFNNKRASVIRSYVSDATAAGFKTAMIFAVTRNNADREVLRIDPFSSTTTTSIVLDFNGTMKRIEVGAADSGGTGYRMLRITN